jgi:hypothetical protein
MYMQGKKYFIVLISIVASWCSHHLTGTLRSFLASAEGMVLLGFIICICRVKQCFSILISIVSILVLFLPVDLWTRFISCSCGGDVISWKVWKGRSYLQVIILFVI